MIVLWILLALVLLVLLISYVCFRMAFYASRKEVRPEFDIPEGEIYEPFREKMVNWMKQTRALPREDMAITAFDGLKLTGKYYHVADGAPLEIQCHGYKGNAIRDFAGAWQIANCREGGDPYRAVFFHGEEGFLI